MRTQGSERSLGCGRSHIGGSGGIQLTNQGESTIQGGKRTTQGEHFSEETVRQIQRRFDHRATNLQRHFYW